uniref:ABC transporter permease n=1 Tax=Caldisericum exile TaxID=693075 RepID=A0A7C4XUH8_9BACT
MNKTNNAIDDTVIEEVILNERATLAKDVLRRFKKNKLAVFGSFIIFALLITAIFAPVIAPYSYREQNLEQALLPPSRVHPFGTDFFGRDVFSRVIYGARISIAVSIIPVAISTILGVLFGSISGYKGGTFDLLFMRFVDIMFAFPDLLFVIAISFAIGRGLFTLFIALAIVGWPGDARIIRSQVISIKQKEYIEAARAIGMSDMRILFRHVLPNCIAPIIVLVSLSIPGVILSEATYSFLGLGAQPPTPSWGAILNDGQRFIRNAPWIAIWPGIAIFITVLAYNLIGNGLRDALDPFLKR